MICSKLFFKYSDVECYCREKLPKLLYSMFISVTMDL